MKTETDLRNEIADIIKNGVTYSPQVQSVVIHGAIDGIIKLINRQEKAAYDLATDVSIVVTKQIQNYDREAYR